MEAMIFAAGLGTRLKKETLEQPKALVKIGNKTLLQLAIENVKKQGIESVVVNVHHFAKLVKKYLAENNFGIPVVVSDESDELLDTGGGLKKAAQLFSKKTPVLLYNVDIISNIRLQQVIDFHKSAKSLATLVVRSRKTQRYLKFDQNKQLAGWINKTTGDKKIARPNAFLNAQEMAFSGIHIVEPELFNHFPSDKKFSIIDFYLELAKTQPIYGYYDNSDLWMDVGNPKKLAMARKILTGENLDSV